MSVTVLLPSGTPTSFQLSQDMTVEQLREKVATETRKIPGLNCVRADDMRLTLKGETLQNSSRLVPHSVMHLTLRVHGG